MFGTLKWDKIHSWPVLETGSQLPSFCATTDSILENILFSDDDIITHIRCLNPNKAHGGDGITIHMIQICDDTLVTPVYYLYQLY